MLATFEFATAQRILFGVGAVTHLVTLARPLGGRALIILGSSNPELVRPISALDEAGLVAVRTTVDSEPSVPFVIATLSLAREHACDMVIAMGGGSAIDTAKAVGALLTNPGDPLDYLEVVGKGRPLANPSAPVIAVPTTAGTGAEVTRNAVLAVPEHRVKVSLRSPTMLPAVALVDPELTLSLPPSITASTGLDALTQCIEPLVSNQANPLTDAIAAEGITRAARSLLRAVQQGDDLDARTDMALASLCGGLALANAKLGAVHGFAGVLGGMYPIPHGIVCARLLPFTFAANVAALRDRAPNGPLLARFGKVAHLVTGEAAATAQDAVTWISELCDALDVPGLAAYGVEPSAFDEIIAKSQASSSMKGNPLPLTDDELHAILLSAL